MKNINKIVSIITLLVFLSIVFFFSIFGKIIRDNNSPRVAVTQVTFYLFGDDEYMSMALPNECFLFDEVTNDLSLYYIEKNEDSGEEAFFAVKTENFEIGRIGDLYTEVLRGEWVNKDFIYKSDRSFKNGARVVVAKEEDLH